MQQRRRSWRRSWPLKNTEPVAGNFYPVTSAATLRGAATTRDEETAAAEFELSLVTDRPQAVASLESGSMHVLLHRRLLTVRPCFLAIAREQSWIAACDLIRATWN